MNLKEPHKSLDSNMSVCQKVICIFRIQDGDQDGTQNIVVYMVSFNSANEFCSELIMTLSTITVLFFLKLS